MADLPIEHVIPGETEHAAVGVQPAAPSGTAAAVREARPSWLKVRAPGGPRYVDVKERLRGLSLHTVCEEARCPNMGECWSAGTATVMILGDTCTRGCRFCAVDTGKPTELDWAEPGRVALAISQMGLDYVVLTSVNRDELEDGGSTIFAMTVKAVKARQPSILVEVLTPDFQGKLDCVERVVAAGPETYAHNVETVERLQRRVRDARANYAQSLRVLEHAKVKRALPHALTKTSIMLGLGETDAELEATLADLRGVGCDVVTFGQYLRPTKKHLPVKEYVTPERFEALRVRALELGFVYCASGPLVRSSYKAGEYFLTQYHQRAADPGTAGALS
ncbi:MAG: lipoyl synthase [Myxococcales bacterium]|nr:lipoyl synthase [Myxococcales bacterium]